MRKGTTNIAFLLLAIWLILMGLSQLFAFSFAGMGVIMGLLALVAGLLFLFGNLRW
jgi:hypothetical protein